jgi:hypothetical protein
VIAGKAPTDIVPVIDCDVNVTGIVPGLKPTVPVICIGLAAVAETYNAPPAVAESGTNVPALFPPTSVAVNGVAVPVPATELFTELIDAVIFAATVPVTQIAEAAAVD